MSLSREHIYEDLGYIETPDHATAMRLSPPSNVTV